MCQECLDVRKSLKVYKRFFGDVSFKLMFLVKYFPADFQLFTIRFLLATGIQIRQRSNLTAIFFAFPQGFNTDYSNVSRIKPPHCFAGGAFKQNG